MTLNEPPPQRTFSEREVAAMKDAELMAFIRQTVATLNQLGDRLEAFAPPSDQNRSSQGGFTP